MEGETVFLSVWERQLLEGGAVRQWEPLLGTSSAGIYHRFADPLGDLREGNCSRSSAAAAGAMGLTLAAPERCWAGQPHAACRQSVA